MGFNDYFVYVFANGALGNDFVENTKLFGDFGSTLALFGSIIDFQDFLFESFFSLPGGRGFSVKKNTIFRAGYA